MVKSKLSQLLINHKITPYRFAQAVKATGARSESWAYRTARGEIKLTADGLALIVEVLRSLTGKRITFNDVVEIAGDEDEANSQPASDRQREQDTLSAIYSEAEPKTDEVLAPYVQPVLEEPRVYRTKRTKLRSKFPLIVSLMAFSAVGILIGFYGKTFLDGSRASQLQVTKDGPIPTPIAIGPEGEVQGTEPKLRIEPISDATHYVYSVFNLLSRQNVVYENSSEPFLIVPKNALCPNARYAWKAKAFRGAEESSFSSNMEFSIYSKDPRTQKYAIQSIQPNIPTAIGPKGIVADSSPVLEVKPVPTAIGYGFYLRDLTTDQVYDFEYQALAPKFKVPRGILAFGRRYRWNARAFNCAGFSLGYSDTLSFEVAPR